MGMSPRPLTFAAQAALTYATYLPSDSSTRKRMVSSIVKRTSASSRRSLLNSYVSMLLSCTLYQPLPTSLNDDLTMALSVEHQVSCRGG